MTHKIRSPCIAVSVALMALLAPIASAQNVLFGWKVFEFQPDIANGGRANTISVNPANNDHILVASETGGLFRSTDRGATWKHVDGLPEFRTFAVAFVPADTNVVIATVGEDMRVSNGGGIWRSTDGGLTWTQIPGPPAQTGDTTRLGAYEISIAPDNGTIYVGTQYGVSISHDRGATWTHTNPFAANDQALAVLGQSGNHVLTAGTGGIRRSIDGGVTWSTPAMGAGLGGGAFFDIHALGGSPFASDQAYVVNRYRQLWFTEDAGDHWTKITSAFQGFPTCGGTAFVKAIGRTNRAPLTPRTRSVVLYYGNRCELARLTAPEIPGTGRFNYGGMWQYLDSDHGDTRDLAFTNGKIRQPLLLADDGGLHKTADGGLNWTFVGGGHNGYNALQITEVKGQWITGINRFDLYFGTQDNYLWASANLGTTWINPVCCEGFFIELQHRVATAADSKITFVACGPCNDSISNPLFTGIAAWPDATTPPAGNPKIVRKSFHVQAVDSNAVFFGRGLGVTTNLGSTWSQYAMFLEDRRDLPKLSDPGTLPVLYQPIRTGFDAARKFEINQLVRIVKSPVGAGGDVTYPLMNSFGGLGINPTMFAWYQVFGVDPGNAQHLIAPDVINEKMMESVDGGDNWTEIPNLTSQITDGGQFLFHQSIFPLASAVSFSPDNPNIVAIGTSQAGLFMSGDRGATWWRVPGSDVITYITSVEWRSANDAIISTYGRGLWWIHWGLLMPLPEIGSLCELPCTVQPIPPLGGPIEKLQHAVLVFGGGVQGARVSKGALKELFVSPGTSVVFFSDSRKEMSVKVTESGKAAGFSGMRMPRSAERRMLVGLTLGARDNPIGAAFADKPLVLYEPSEQEKNQVKEPSGGKTSPTADRAYISLTMPGGSAGNTVLPEAPLRISARNFQRGASLEIAVDDSTVERVRVGDKGEFTVTIRAPSEFGLHRVTVRDAATGKVIDGANFIVKAEDTRRERGAR